MAPRVSSASPNQQSPLHQIGANINNPNTPDLVRIPLSSALGRGRGHRVRLGQPDVQGEQARLGRKAHQGQPYRHRKPGAIREGPRRLPSCPAKDSVPS